MATATVVAVALAVSGCAGGRSLLPGLAPTSPRDRYAAALAGTGLASAALARDWTAAGDAALAAPVDVVLPFRETGYLDAARPAAVAYRMTLQRGRMLLVDVLFESSVVGRLFVEVFSQHPNDPTPVPVANLEDNATSLQFEVERDGTYLLRVQPELLRGGRFTLTQRTQASLRTFPVLGMTARAVQSSFGAGRDAGIREHQGIDIFAPRGTPVIAVVGGSASASTNTLGGKVVWLRDRVTRRTFYYAHLDRWANDATVNVAAGDVIGYVGNTGNARTTPPHLHFGLYSPRPINPLPFLAPDDVPAEETGPPPAFMGDWGRVTAATSPLRSGADARSPSRVTLRREAVVRIEAAARGSYRVALPDGVLGYVAATDIAAADRTPLQATLKSAARMVDAPSERGVVMEELKAGARIAMLGTFSGYRFVQLSDGRRGWLAVVP